MTSGWISRSSQAFVRSGIDGMPLAAQVSRKSNASVPAPSRDPEDVQISESWFSVSSAVSSELPADIILENCQLARSKATYGIKSVRKLDGGVPWTISGSTASQGEVSVAVGAALKDPVGFTAAFHSSPWPIDVPSKGTSPRDPTLLFALGAHPDILRRWGGMVMVYVPPWSEGLVPGMGRMGRCWDPCHAGCAALWFALSRVPSRIVLRDASSFAVRSDDEGLVDVGGGWRVHPNLMPLAACWAGLLRLADSCGVPVTVEDGWDPRCED